jgi:hypothetical protein
MAWERLGRASYRLRGVLRHPGDASVLGHFDAGKPFGVGGPIGCCLGYLGVECGPDGLVVAAGEDEVDGPLAVEGHGPGGMRPAQWNPYDAEGVERFVAQLVGRLLPDAVQQDGRHVRDSVALRAGQSVPSVDDQYGSAGLADPGKDQGTLQVGARDVVLVQPDGASSRNPCRGSMRRGGRARAICWALVTSHPKPRNWKY